MIRDAERSQREREIAALLATGASNEQIARYLAISEKAIKNTLTNVFAKTNTICRTERAVQLVRAGLPSPCHY